MRWHVMWHQTLKWGPTGIPVLLRSKINAVKGTGLSLATVRRNGWKWMSLDIPEPWVEGRRDEWELETKFRLLAQELEDSGDEVGKIVAAQIREIVDANDIDGSERTVVDANAEARGSKAN